MALGTLQTIFHDVFPAYEQAHPLPAHVRKAARAIMPCRTAALGGHVQACPDGHVSPIWDNACRHRSGPPCASLQTERWLTLQPARLLACEHAHVILTLPHDLQALWLAKVPLMTARLFQAVRATLVDVLGAPQSLGAQPGIIAALPTWSQTLLLPPHVHGLVTGGGRTASGAWQAVRHGFLLPARVGMAVLRGKMLAALRQAWARGAVTRPEPLRSQPWRNLLNRLGHPQKTPWHGWLLARSRHGAGVGTYLARSLRGGPLKNARLVAWDGERGTFLYRARHEAADGGRPASLRMTLPVADFLQRRLLHGPTPQTRGVRSYGLSPQTSADALAGCRAALGHPPVATPAGLDWQTVCSQAGGAHPERCPTCGQRLVCTGGIPRGGAPPGRWAGERAA